MLAYNLHNTRVSLNVSLYKINQAGPLPSIMRDIYCNPSLMPGGCSTLAEWGRAFGVPMRTLLINSQLGALSQRLGGTLNLLHVRFGIISAFLQSCVGQI